MSWWGGHESDVETIHMSLRLTIDEGASAEDSKVTQPVFETHGSAMRLKGGRRWFVAMIPDQQASITWYSSDRLNENMEMIMTSKHIRQASGLLGVVLLLMQP